jgi:hypothetical protein
VNKGDTKIFQASPSVLPVALEPTRVWKGEHLVLNARLVSSRRRQRRHHVRLAHPESLHSAKEIVTALIALLDDSAVQPMHRPAYHVR